MFGNPFLTWMAVSIIVGGPLGWLAWVRGYRRRAGWVWLSTLLGLGLPLGVWAMMTTREPLVPWRCPACDALTQADRSHTVARATGFTLEPSEPGTIAVVGGGMAGIAALLLTARLLLAADATAPVWLITALILGGFAAISWGMIRIRRHRVPRTLVIGYICRACGTDWEVETDPDQGPNQAGALITKVTDLDDASVVEGLMTFITGTVPYGLVDHITRWDAVQAITRIDGVVASNALIRLLDDPLLVETAIGGLTRLRDTRALPALTRVLTESAARAHRDDSRDAETAARHASVAAEALGLIGDGRAAPDLQRIVDHPATPRELREAALHALERLSLGAAA